MTLHVVGNVCIDTTFRLARFPRPGETLNADAAEDGIGGKGANQAVAARRAGAAVRLHAAVGEDAAADSIRRRLAAEGLDPHDLVRAEGPSDRSSILVDRSGENLIVTAAPRARGFDPLAARCLDDIGETDILLMQGNLPPAATLACLALARRRGARTIVNASPLADAEAWHFDDVDVLVVNAGEAEALSGARDPAGAARRLRARAACCVVTLGADGALLAGEGRDAVAFAAPSVVARDTSGAGDVLCGVLAGFVARGRAVEDALGLAVLAAGLCVTRPGTLASCPSAAEIAALRRTP